MKQLITIMLLCSTLILRSQTKSLELVSTSGGNFKNCKVELSWSIGEVAAETYSNTENILNQGFHQSNIEIVNEIDNVPDIHNIKVYPNPAINEVTVQIDDINLNNLFYQLVDLNGQVLLQKTINRNDEQIDLNNYSQGLYLLYIFSDNMQKISIYKIRKIN